MSENGVPSTQRRAVILAGGLGMRLRPYTTVLPKPLMPVGDRPILDVIVRQLRAARLRARHDRHRPPRRADRGVLRRRLEATGSRSTTSARTSRSARSARSRSLDDLDERLPGHERRRAHRPRLRRLADGHIDSGAAATIAAHKREVQISLGVLQFDDDADPDRLTGYVEKPTYHYEVSMGVYAFAPRVLEHDRARQAARLPRPRAAADRGGRDGARRGAASDYWLDIGRHDDYETAHGRVRAHARPLPARRVALE